jgi:hypothetical protein
VLGAESQRFYGLNLACPDLPAAVFIVTVMAAPATGFFASPDGRDILGRPAVPADTATYDGHSDHGTCVVTEAERPRPILTLGSNCRPRWERLDLDLQRPQPTIWPFDAKGPRIGAGFASSGIRTLAMSFILILSSKILAPMVSHHLLRRGELDIVAEGRARGLCSQ